MKKNETKLLAGLIGGLAISVLFGYFLVLNNNRKTETISGKEAVNLGLSVKWATINEGAEDRNSPGNQYSWEEAMAAAYEDGWRLPTEEEVIELIYRCTWRPVNKDGRVGIRGRSLLNDREIFLPSDGLAGIYWTSTTAMADSTSATRLAFSPALCVAPNHYYTLKDNRLMIRLVHD